MILAYAISAIILIFSNSWIFQLDVLCVPHVSSSILGLISIIYGLSNHHGALSVGTSTAHFAILFLVLSVASVVVYSILSALIFRKIYIVRAKDAMFRFSPQNKEKGPLREDEEQRRQLSRLLLQQNEKTTLTPGSGTQTTFKIEWAGNSKLQSRRSSFAVAESAPGFNVMNNHSSRGSLIPGTGGQLTGGIERLPSIKVQEPSRFSLWFGSSRRNSIYDPPTDHLTGGIERVPTMDQQGSSPTTAQDSTSADDGPAPLRPIAYVPRSQNARYFGLDSPRQPGSPQSALPSYSPYAHPSMNISTRPLSHFHENGFPIEKQEAGVYTLPAPTQQRPIREGPYRMADQE